MSSIRQSIVVRTNRDPITCRRGIRRRNCCQSTPWNQLLSLGGPVPTKTIPEKPDEPRGAVLVWTRVQRLPEPRRCLCGRATSDGTLPSSTRGPWQETTTTMNSMLFVLYFCLIYNKERVFKQRTVVLDEGGYIEGVYINLLC